MESTNIPLISCEVSLELKWDKKYVITSLEQRDIGGGNRDNAPTGATLAMNDCKLYIPVWSIYRSQMTTEAINNNLNIFTDLTFTNVNRLFVLAYQTANHILNFIYQELWLKILMLLLIR